MRFATVGLLVASTLFLGCDDDKDSDTTDISGYSSSIESKSGSTVEGQVDVVSENGKVTITVRVTGATPGEHGVHLHQNPDCSADDASSAGAHWNPTSAMHGSHLGDLGNIKILADGTGELTVTKSEWKLEDGSDHDVLGHSLVVHAGTDDLMTDPSGNSGGRQGCAEITDF